MESDKELHSPWASHHTWLGFVKSVLEITPFASFLLRVEAENFSTAGVVCAADAGLGWQLRSCGLWWVGMFPLAGGNRMCSHSLPCHVRSLQGRKGKIRRAELKRQASQLPNDWRVTRREGKNDAERKVSWSGEQGAFQATEINLAPFSSPLRSSAAPAPAMHRVADCRFAGRAVERTGTTCMLHVGNAA